MRKAIGIVGDRWTLLVVEQLVRGVTRFSAIQHDTRMPRDRLTDRLRKLEQAGVIARRAYCERPMRYEYELTCSGRALLAVLEALYAWRLGFPVNQQVRVAGASPGATTVGRARAGSPEPDADHARRGRAHPRRS